MINFLFKIFLLSRQKKQIIVLLNDIILSIFSSLLSLTLLQQNFYFPSINQWYVISLGALFFIPFFVPFGLYQAIFRYSGINTLINIFFASFIYGLIFFLIVYFSDINHILPNTFGILQPLIFFVLVAFSRAGVVVLMHNISYRKRKIISLIYGAGKTGLEASDILSDFKIIGFIDDDKTKQGKKINNINIYQLEETKLLIEKNYVSHVFVAIPKIKRKKRREIIKFFENYKIGLKFLPNIEDLAQGKKTIDSFNKFEVSDFIHRNIEWETEKVRGELSNKVILITGAGGSIGAELCKQIINYKPTMLVMIDNNEYNLYSINNDIQEIIIKANINSKIKALLFSVCDHEKIDEIFRIYKPEIVFHAAAYKQVPLLEMNILSAIQNNIFGTITIAEAVYRNNTKKLVFISTDKAVKPANIMGATKRFAEIYLQSIYNKYSNKNIILSSVRFGNVFGSTGSVVPLFNEQILNGGPVTVTHPTVTRYFMSTPEAVGLVLEANHLSKGGDVFVLNMGEPIKVHDLAKKMIRLSGYNEKGADNPDGDIEIVFIGLRPGEKLNEELLIGNNPLKTSNKDIMRAEEEFIEWDQLEIILNDLKKVIKLSDSKGAVKIIKQSTKMISAD